MAYRIREDHFAQTGLPYAPKIQISNSTDSCQKQLTRHGKNALPTTENEMISPGQNLYTPRSISRSSLMDRAKHSHDCMQSQILVIHANHTQWAPQFTCRRDSQHSQDLQLYRTVAVLGKSFGDSLLQFDIRTININHILHKLSLTKI